MNEEVKSKNSTVVTVLITLLVVALIGSISFIVYDKVIKKEEVKTEENNNENSASSIINNAEVKELISKYEDSIKANVHYGMNILSSALDLTNKYQYNYKMYFTDNSLYDLSIEYQNEHNTSETKISKEDMRKQFIFLFGPDSEYKDGSFYIPPNNVGTSINNDVYENGMYVNLNPGGYDTPVTYEIDFYKAEQENNIISTYWYSYELDGFDGKNEIVSNGKIIGTYTEETIENDINKLKESGKISTYKINFKKQSDGKYYLYSGEWQ